MIADASLSNAFDDLADLFLGDAVSQTPPSARSQPAPSGPIDHPDPRVPDRPVAVEGLVLGHLPMMGSLWASQYVRMAAAAENGPVALVRLDHGTARVELFGPTCSHVPSRASCVGDGGASDPERQLTELGTALARARRLARRIVVFSSLPADELLLAGSSAVRSMSLLTGADDASAVGAYKALKRLGHSADAGGAPRSVLFRVAVMGSDEQRATAAFHRLAEAARSFLALPIELAGHCRQIAGGVPGAVLFDGASAMTVQAVLESLSQPAPPESRPSSEREPADPRSTPPLRPTPPSPMHINGHATASPRLPDRESATPPAPPAPAAYPRPESPSTPTLSEHLPPGLTPLPVRCPFDRATILAIDAAGVPQVVAHAPVGDSPIATQRLLAVGAWLWTSRELLAAVCPTLCADARPVLHLVTERPTDVNRLIDSDLRLHLRIPRAAAGTLPLN